MIFAIIRIAYFVKSDSNEKCFLQLWSLKSYFLVHRCIYFRKNWNENFSYDRIMKRQIKFEKYT